MDLYTALHLFFIVFIAGFAWACIKGAPWVPTRQKNFDYLLSNLDLPENAKVCDLGCGDGRMVFSFAKSDKVAQAIGYELAWPMYMFCQLKKMFVKDKNSTKISFALKDLFKVDVSDMDLVFCFLMPNTLKKLTPKTFKEMKSGALFISSTFALEGMAPLQVIKRSNMSDPLYVYKK